MTQTISYSFEDAISETKFGKFNHFMIVLAGLILACGMLETNCINMIIPIAQCEFNMSEFDKGLLGSIGYLGIILASQIWGFLADTRGRKKIIVPALVLSFIFTVLSTFTNNFWLLVIFRFLNGFCICAPQTIIYAFLGEFHSAKHRARVLIVASVMYGIFCFINPINGILFLNQETWNIHIPLIDLNYNAWRIFLIMCSVPSVISALLMNFFVPESPKFTYAQGDEVETLKILQRIYKFNTGKNDYKVTSLIKDQEFEDASNEKPKGFFEFLWSQTVPLFKQPHLKNTLTACYLQFGICVACNGFWTFFPDLTNKVSIWLNGDPSHTTATICTINSSFNTTITTENISTTCVTKLEIETLANVSVLTLLYSIFWFLISIIINRVGKLIIIVVVSFACGLASILLMFLQFPQVSVYIYIVLLMTGLNMSVVNTSTVELFPTTLRAMAVSISMMFGRVGSVVGSNFVGLTIENYCTYTFILPAVLLISGGFLAFTIPNINKRHKN
ncbi:hypothetical protein PVAND_012392 [Polypedilum vanderplanki]|uniref:Major facilitator superfamily (MFS) profile domain-containing protein n=1 Tax=Polypedilum vanderplanki TaxID=319348 RepID=A0A9J6CLG4_POLVA|nr:hypothetical protein PVAND_012392 [Polypedilum vanderplanki]